MEEMIKRLVRRLFPELTHGLHLPNWGRVASKPVSIAAPEQSTAKRPLYAVDVQVVDSYGNALTHLPVFKTVPLPATAAGNERGFFGFPPIGTLVEIGFILGLPHKPFIRSVLVEGVTVPELESEDVLIKQSADTFQRATKTGDWYRDCPEKITDTAKNYDEQIAEIKRSFAGLNHHIEVAGGGNMWLGNESHNALALLSQLMGIVQQLATDLSTHVHKDVQQGLSTSGPPQVTAPFTSAASNTGTIKGQLDPFVE